MFSPELLFASSSSVYGNSKNFPLREKHNTDKPLSFYSATKKSNEVGRISIVNYHGFILMDKYIKPLLEIENYLTKYSGLT